ncbi:hypothetical protein [Desulfomicrobium baculatum]|uniref:Uncharacterized protein n=1 Tax=Desulfomicrobium baculatum (strain DSM 4028 / VKM B-1378 / X) TaxID=525897 RepID=C7LS31_DESBD|nr:hypothetical protein [Desulfomicrobium baculatum]ACU89414.1 conserved hypothetical protein [Desulfomicrobium baculatum DSM 4028]
MESLKNVKNIILECPHCKTENKIHLENTNCEKCDKSFSGTKFKKAAASILMTSMLVSSGLFGYKQYQKNSHRYPISVEYSIIDKCVSGSGYLIPREYVSHKLKICVYSLEKSQENISYSEYSGDTAQFANEFQKHAYEASKFLQ